MTDPYYINELHSDLRGVKEGWYAIDERGRLLFGPFSNQEICLIESASQRLTNVESEVYPQSVANRCTEQVLAQSYQHS